MKILTFDIETGLRSCLTFSTGKTWLKGHQFVDKEHLLGFSWKWLGEDAVERLFLHEVGKVAVKKKDDRKLVQKLWLLLDEADAVITYNGNGFDIKLFNAKCLQYGLTPPSPFKSIDLYPVAKRRFKLDDKKLNTVSNALGLGGKDVMTYDDWVECYFNNIEAFEKMATYCDKDVLLTEQVYTKLLPWINNHPNISQFKGEVCCTSCGSNSYSDGGWTIPYVNGKRYRRHVCKDCGKHYVNKNIEEMVNEMKCMVGA